MRFVAAIFAVLLAIALSAQPPRPSTSDLKERVFLSRTCPDSRWYLDTSDDQSATLVCYTLKGDPDQEDGN